MEHDGVILDWAVTTDISRTLCVGKIFQLRIYHQKNANIVYLEYLHLS